LYAFVENHGFNALDFLGMVGGYGGLNNSNYPAAWGNGLPSGSGDGLLESAITTVLSSAFLRCYLIDLTDEELEEINLAIINEMKLADTAYFQNTLAGLPASAGIKFIALNAATRSLLASIPQGSRGLLGVSAQSLAAQFMNRHRILVSVRSRLRDKSIQWVGKGGVKVWGRLGSKFIPIVGWISAGHEAVKACNCYLVTKDDDMFTNDEKIIGQ
jgi:hypothetical protein